MLCIKTTVYDSAGLRATYKLCIFGTTDGARAAPAITTDMWGWFSVPSLCHPINRHEGVGTIFDTLAMPDQHEGEKMIFDSLAVFMICGAVHWCLTGNTFA